MEMGWGKNCWPMSAGCHPGTAYLAVCILAVFSLTVNLGKGRETGHSNEEPIVCTAS